MNEFEEYDNLWIEVDDSTLARKCSQDCDLHIVRPGKVRCNCQ